MKLQEAILHTEVLIDTSPGHLSDDEIIALKLGIEALKRLQKRRERFPFWCFTLLPGETTE